MKIIFITREGYQLSGARIRCYGFANILKNYGLETEVLSFGDHLSAGYGEKELDMSLKEKMQLTYKAFKRLILENRKTVFLIQRFNYHTFAPWLASLLKRNRVIFDMDDWDMRENPAYYFGFYPSSKAEYLTRIIAKHSNACIAASRYLLGYLGRFNKSTYYIPTGVDISKFDYRLNKVKNDKIIFSWVGTLYHKEMFENVNFIIRSFLQLCKKYAHIQLEITGEGKYFSEIKKLLDNQPELRGRIVTRGWISPDQIPAYLSGVDIGLLPLIQNSKFNLAKSPTKLFEYMAMAKPVVASNIGEAGGIVRNGENGFLANTNEEFTVMMEQLIKDAALRETIGLNALHTVEKNYSLDLLGKQLFEIVSSF
jgi:glycosyltransferase involved in cell wall biosynthesis